MILTKEVNVMKKTSASLVSGLKDKKAEASIQRGCQTFAMRCRLPHVYD